MTDTGYRPLRSSNRSEAIRSRLALPGLALLGFILVALNMRAALAAVSPLVDEISKTYGLSSTAGGMITTVPVLAMALGAPFAPKLARRFSTEAVVMGALGLLAVGVLLRVLPSAFALFAGCVLTGLAITALNVLMPGIVKRDFPERVAVMTGLYTTVMISGATVAAAVSVPLDHALGGWQGSLGFWVLLTAVSAIGWFPQVLRRRVENRLPGGPHDGAGETTGPAARGAGPQQVRGLWKNPTAWQISVFMGIASLLVYTTVAWLPSILVEHGMARGTAGSVFAFSNFVQIFSAFLVPLAAGRMRSQRTLVVVMVLLNAAGFAGLLIAPVSGAWLWAVLLGLAQGGSFGLALTMLVLRAGNAAVAAQLSGMAQMIGYLVAAAGPVGSGALRQLTGSWTLPLSLLLGACGIGLVAGLGAARNIKIRLTPELG
jgi:CP family cyanate transporter-like MFS transporter